MRQGSIGAKPFSCADGTRPILERHSLCHGGGRLLALAETRQWRNRPQARVQPRPDWLPAPAERRRYLTMSIDRRTQSGSHQDERTKAGDTGSPEVQVAILSERINNLTEPFQDPREGQPFASRPVEARVAAPPPSRLHQEEGRGALQGADRAAQHPPLSTSRRALTLRAYSHDFPDIPAFDSRKRSCARARSPKDRAISVQQQSGRWAGQGARD